MSLYDDFDKHRTDKVAEWSSGIKLLQSQLQLKKAAPQNKRESSKKSSAILAPVIDLNSKAKEKENLKEDDQPTTKKSSSTFGSEFDWNTDNEYDPVWPNEYEKVVKELRDVRDRDRERKHEQELDHGRKKRESLDLVGPESLHSNENVEETKTRNGGVAIAPPPEISNTVPNQSGSQGYATSSVAAKIMAKYGFKEGQGLGKKEQGISVALQVEKTSKRGGRIVSEREQLMPPPPPLNLSPPSLSSQNAQNQNSAGQDEPSITEIMKAPSKVVLLRNMVGSGEVDDDLEPEVKDECNTKYGDVCRVVIHEVVDAHPEEAVRIFVEFKRIESAIKAVVDLNGRFFGGRQVKAGFYSVEKFNNYQLLD